MGNPPRFFGAGTPIDLREGGTIPGRCAVEVTFRAHQQRFLMRPSTEGNAIVLGCLGRVMARYPELDMYVFSFESNHGSFVQAAERVGAVELHARPLVHVGQAPQPRARAGRDVLGATLTPLPQWADLRPGQLRARVSAIVNDDDAATRERHRREGTRPVGVAAILATDPFSRPAKPKKSPAPLCHASTPALRKGFRAALGEYVRALRGVAERIEDALPRAGLLEGATMAPLAHKPPPSTAHRARGLDEDAAHAAEA